MHAPADAHDKDPKSEAGKRTIAIPPHVVPLVRLLLKEYAGKNACSSAATALRCAATPSTKHSYAPGTRSALNLAFRDLRHTGQTLPAQTGATMADLMKRLGHSSMAAARRHLHTVDGRDREIAPRLSELAAHGDFAELPKVRL